MSSTASENAAVTESDARSAGDEESPVSVLDVLAFVWGYWRALPIRFSLIVAGVLVATAVEMGIPDRAAALMSAVERFARGEGSIDPAWPTFFQLVGLY